MKDEWERPDPKSGVEAGPVYADVYVQDHLRTPIDDPAYRLWYSDILLVDAILKDYTMLDVGCCSGGHLRLARNHRLIVGIDFSRTTIEAAVKHQAALGVQRVHYEVSAFETYEGGPFDVVNMRGIYGHYKPWRGNEDILDHVKSLLKPGSILITSFVKPKTVFHYAKALLFPTRTIVIREKTFDRIMTNAGFQKLVSFDTEMATVVLSNIPSR